MPDMTSEILDHWQDVIVTSTRQSQNSDSSDEDPIVLVPLPSRPVSHSILERSFSKRLRTQLIIGIDFGTTFSGASYALVHPGADPASAKISVVRNWRGELPGNTTSNKVPSLIAINEDGEYFWGFDIPHELQGGAFKWLKLLLEPKQNLKEIYDAIFDPSITVAKLRDARHDAVEMASEYLRLLFEHAKCQIIREHSQATYNFATKSIVLTVPAVWSDAAKHNTYLVAAGAGLADDEYQLQIVSEPEAAAIAVLQDRGSLLEVNDCYIIVDAGGGTVDLTSYILKSVEPIKLSEVVAGEGGVCGAVFLELNFNKLLRTYLGEELLESLPPENLARINNDFETGIRKVFDGEDRTNYAVAMTGISDSSSSKIKAGLLRLSAAELKPVFTPVVDKIERLIRRQITGLKKKGHVPKAILLVGGFGTNTYLAKRLRDIYQPSKGSETDGVVIEVLQPNIGWESIANGAVRCEAMGLGDLVSLRIARFNIGIKFSQSWDSKKHLEEHKYKYEFTGEWRANEQITWYLRRHEKIEPGHVVNFPVSGDTWLGELEANPDELFIKWTICHSSEDDAPDHRNSHTHFFVSLTFRWDLRKYPMSEKNIFTSPDGRRYQSYDYTIHMQQGPAKMEFWYTVGGERRGNAESVDFVKLPIAKKDGPRHRPATTLLERMEFHRRKPGSKRSSAFAEMLPGDEKQGRMVGHENAGTSTYLERGESPGVDAAFGSTTEVGRMPSEPTRRRPLAPGRKDRLSRSFLSKLADVDGPSRRQRRGSPPPPTAATRSASQTRKGPGSHFYDQIPSENINKYSELPVLPSKRPPKSPWK